MKSMQERNAELDSLLAEWRPQIEEHWENCREDGLDAATQVATDKVDACIDDFFADLKKISKVAGDVAVLGAMERLYKRLDEINSAQDHGLLETDERELLVPLFIAAAEICGVDPDKYDGEPGGEFREF